jgi:hypothetical protein
MTRCLQLLLFCVCLPALAQPLLPTIKPHPAVVATNQVFTHTSDAPPWIIPTNQSQFIGPLKIVTALVWSNVYNITPTNFLYWIVQQSSDMTNWQNLTPWWFASTSRTVMLVTSGTQFEYYRLMATNVFPIVGYSPLAPINNGQNVCMIQVMFSNELSTANQIVVLKTSL